MKKKFIYGTIAVLGLYFVGKRVFKEKTENVSNQKQENLNSAKKGGEEFKEDEEDYIDILRNGTDPLTDLRHRRSLYVMSRIAHCNIDTEEGRQEQDDFIKYFKKLNFSTWYNIMTEINKVPEVDEEGRRRHLRFWVILGQSRDAFWKYSIDAKESAEELEIEFDFIRELDLPIEKWGAMLKLGY